MTPPLSDSRWWRRTLPPRKGLTQRYHVELGPYRFVIQANNADQAAAELGRRLLTLNVATITDVEEPQPIKREPQPIKPSPMQGETTGRGRRRS